MSIVFRYLGLQAYEPIWRAMQRFTEARHPETPDEIWLLEHFPVYTQGMAGKAAHIIDPQNIPIIQTDRGGQVTYHGPGQLVVYFMLDVARRGLAPRQLVSRIENAVIALLHEFGIKAIARQDAPGIYVEGKKIASLGLRVRQQGSYHGLAFNVDMDLAPFLGINPCGFEKLSMTQLRALLPSASLLQLKEKLPLYLLEMIDAP